MQIREIINLAASRFGAINFGENLDSSSAQLMLKLLKMVLSELSIRPFNYKHYEYLIDAKSPITLGTDSQTLLPGDIAERPIQIDDIIYEAGSINYPLEIRPYNEFRDLSMNNMTSIPQYAFIDYDTPYITIHFYPKATSNKIRILGKGNMITRNATINDYIEIPEEFELAVVTSLALKSCGYFGVTPSQSMIIENSSALKHFRELNLMKNRTKLKNDVDYGDDSRNILFMVK